MAALHTLRERIESYENSTDYKLLRKLPIVITLNGRSFKKTTSLLKKPYDHVFTETMCGVMVKLASEIDGSVFIYSFNDEIVIVARNDQTNDTDPWYDNKIQKIVSAAASIATSEFNKTLKLNNMQILGDCIFTSNCYVVPTITEAVNVLIAKQQQAFHSSLYFSCFYELLKKYDIETVRSTMNDKTAQEKAEILFEKCDINFTSYPLPFRQGVASYRVPKVIKTADGDEIKNKLVIDMELPIFTKDQEFLTSIFKSGRDIFRNK